MKIKDYIDYWYKTYRMIRHERSTVNLYRTYIRVHIAPSDLGGMRIQEARTQDYQMFINELATSGCRLRLNSMDRYGEPLSPSTVSKIRRMLIAMCDAAIKEGMLTENHAAKTEAVPVKKKRRHEVFTPDQQAEFLRRAERTRDYAAYVLAFYTGMRRGEILGLSWRNVNFTAKTIDVIQTLLVERGKPVLRKWHAKTELSIRTLPMANEMAEILRRHKEKQDRMMRETGCGNPEGMCFIQADGQFINPQHFSRNFKNMCIKMGLPPSLHLHCTRHTWATNMMQAGCPIPDIQALGGWSSPDMLLNVYAHTRISTHRSAMERLFEAQGIDGRSREARNTKDDLREELDAMLDELMTKRKALDSEAKEEKEIPTLLVEEGNDSKGNQISDEVSPKRRRGRPPKNKEEKADCGKNEKPAKRSAKKEKSAGTTAEKRRRGRHPKVKGGESAKVAMTEKRRRGRPPKPKKGSDSKAGEGLVQPAKKRRGRPPKAKL